MTNLGELGFSVNLDSAKVDNGIENIKKKLEQLKTEGFSKLKLSVEAEHLRTSVQKALKSSPFLIDVEISGADTIKNSFDLKSLHNYSEAIGLLESKIKQFELAMSTGSTFDYTPYIAQLKALVDELEQAKKESIGLTDASKSVAKLAEVKNLLKGIDGAVRGAGKGSGLTEADKIARTYAMLEKQLASVKRELMSMYNLRVKFPEIEGTDAHIKKLQELQVEIEKAIKAQRIFSVEQTNDLRGRVTRTVSNSGLFRADYTGDEAARKRYLQDLTNANSALKEQMDIVDGLKSVLGEYFGLTALKNFAVGVIEIGGEFEKQRIALKSMLGDLTKAETLFSQVKTLAVKSPFEFKQLSAYTKQMAAYGIPYEELYDTTKRLADVSAGLGVDMQRLILAYGQVRSATVLKGTELRQFTEAGVPLVQALADKIGEMNGRLVTTGEVFSMISKKQIPFEYVRDILFQMTDEGGQFFNMQAELAETVAGKWANLRDAYDIMLSEIEEGNSGALGGAINLVYKLLQNWRDLVPVVASLAVAYGGLRLAETSITAVQKMQILTTMKQNKAEVKQTLDRLKLTAATRALTAAEREQMAMANRMLIMTNPWLMWGIAIAGAVAALMSFTSEASRAAEEIERINEEVKTEATSSIVLMNSLARKTHDVSLSTRERSEAMDELNRKYGQYLPSLITEADSLDVITQKTKEAAAAIREKAKADLYERQVGKYSENYEKRMNSLEEQGLTEAIGEEYYKKFGQKISQSLSEQIKFAVRSGVESGLDSKQIKSKLQELFGIDFSYSYENIDGQTMKVASKTLSYINNMVAAHNNFLLQVENANDVARSMFGDDELGAYTHEIDQINKKWEELGKQLNKANNSYEIQYGRLKEIANFLEGRGLTRLNAYTKIMGELAELSNNEQFKQSLKADLEKVSRDNELIILVDQNKTMDKFIEAAKAGYKSAKKFIDENSGLALKYDIQFTSGMTKEQIEAKQNEIDNNASIPFAYKQQLRDYLEYMKYISDLTNTEQQTGLSLHDETKSKSSSSKDAVNEKWKNRINLIKEAYSEYKKWSDVMSKEDALNKVKSSGLFDELNGELPDSLDSYRNMLKNILDEMGDASKLSEQRKQTRRSILQVLTGIDNDEMKEEFNKSQKIIEQFISNIKEQWSLYEKVLESTSDRNLAIRLAFNGEVSFGNIAEQIKAEIEKILEGNSLSFADVVNLDSESIDKLKISGLPELVKAYNDETKKLKQDSIENFLDIIKASNDYSQQIEQINKDLQKNLEDLRKNAVEQGMSSEEVKRREKYLTDKAQEEKSNVLFEQFKNTTEWTKAFDDLDRVSTNTITTLLGQIKDFANNGDLGVKTVKELQNAMKKLREEAIERNPIKSMADSMKELNQWRDIKNGKDGWAYMRSDNKYVRADSKTGDVQVIKGEDVENGISASLEDLKDEASSVAQKFKAVGDAADMLTGLFENLFGSSHFTEDLSSVIGGGVSGATAGAGLMQAFRLEKLGVWGAAAGAALNVVSQIAALHDKALQREIDASKRRQKEMENLSSNLERVLERTMGGIYATKGENGKSYYDTQYDLLVGQRNELQSQYNAENDKKKKDKDALIDYKQQIEELNDEIWHFSEDMANALYGIDFHSWAEDLADSIVDAWAKGEDAAEAWKDKVRDIMGDVVKSVIAKNYIEKALEAPMKAFLDEFNRADGILDETQIANLANSVVGAYDGVSATIPKILDSLKNAGLDLSETSKKSGLSAGIKGITEDTANLLSSYVNSIRSDLSAIRVTQEDFYPEMSVIAQSQLQQLEAIVQNTGRNADLTDEIYRLLNGVTNGTYKFAVK